MYAFSRARGLTTARDGALALLLIACPMGAWIPAHAAIPLLHHDDRLHREIESLESEWRNALIQNDVATVNNLLADDYLGINPDGTLETKADALALRRSGVMKISRLEPVNVKVHVYGDTAVVTSQVDMQGQDGDRDISGRYHYTRVYSHKSGAWKIVSFEASRMPAGRH